MDVGGEQLKTDAQDAVDPRFGEQARQQDRPGGRRLAIGIGQPGMERKKGCFHSKGKQKDRKEPRRRRSCFHAPLEEVHIKCGGPGSKVEGKHSREHQSRAGDHIEQKLEGGIAPVGAAPDREDEIERDQHRLPKDGEERQIARREEADQNALQHQDQSIEETRG